MGTQEWFHVAGMCWLVFLLYWLVSASKLKAVKRREPIHERLFYMAPMIVAYVLLFSDWMTFTELGRRFMRPNPRISALGVAVTAVGVGLAIWARWHLGENWSAAVTLKKDHELISTGPYRGIRHPIYTGMMVAMAGTALALGEVRGLIALVITMVAFYFKARKEERYMMSEFGEKYIAYKNRTGMLLPKLP
ncbi:MAG TPA: isoprenylcysteine carboxylmethyltransferase family protein [Terriglobales bacterium]|nr:isoprenylcysteine carboxylmethyltransferase family protein [Terriglobales bacterium]HUL17400.1 isoprenylcysteine carboxylmethyltransferase family protein [Terriglobales bacterium]